MREMGTHVDRQYASRVAAVCADTLEKSLDDKKEWPARAYSVRLLGEAGYTGSLEGIATCVADDVANVRQAAGYSLEKLSSLAAEEHRTAVPAAFEAAVGESGRWRKTAVAARAIGYYAGEDFVEPLSLLLSHSVLNVRESASHSLVTMVERKDEKLSASIQSTVIGELESNSSAWQYGAPVLGALEKRDGLPLLTKILADGNWYSVVAAANAVNRIAAVEKVNDKKLSDALIAAGESDIVQVQEACDRALRTLTQ